MLCSGKDGMRRLSTMLVPTSPPDLVLACPGGRGPAGVGSILISGAFGDNCTGGGGKGGDNCTGGGKGGDKGFGRGGYLFGKGGDI